jgi:hypothetical protein
MERRKAAAGQCTRSIVEIPDAPDFGRLLSVRRARPDRSSTEESYELAPSHTEHSFLLGAGATCRACGLAMEPQRDERSAFHVTAFPFAVAKA